MEIITCKNILEAVAQIKHTKTPIYSNYLPLLGYPPEEKFKGILGKNTVLFLTKENIVHRIVFYSTDRAELVELLKACPTGLGLDYASNLIEIEDDFITEAGFRKIAILQKLVFPDATMSESELMENEKLRAVYQNRNDDIVEYANEKDIDEIFSMLNKIFNSYIDHLPTKEELLENFIKKEGMLVYREDDKIQAIVGYLLNGVRMFWIYAINNSGNYKNMSALVVKLRDIALEKGVKHMHGFLELSETRQRAFKYYQRRNTKFADFYNHVYANCDIK